MPRRTNLQQAVIFYVKKHLAPIDAVVTESRMLRDADSGEEHEVDVVVEGQYGSDDVLISVEVTGRNRPADTPWVNTMIQKHARMPTQRLVLVSWSGFTGPAMAKVKAQGGQVVALTPEPVPHADVPPLTYLEVRRLPDTRVNVYGPPGASGGQAIGSEAYLHDGPPSYEPLMPLLAFVDELLDRRSSELMDQVQRATDKASVSYFTWTLDNLEDRGFYLRDSSDDLMHLVSGLHIEGPIAATEQSLEFTAMRLADEIFAFSTFEMMGSPAVWVLVPRGSRTMASWRAL